MGSFKGQLKQVLRRLGRAPMFTAIILVTLAVGVGANTAIFSVIEGILLKPLPYPHPEKLVAVSLTAPGIGIKDLNPSPADYLVYREQSRNFQDIGLYTGVSRNVTGIAQPEHVGGLDVTDGVLPTGRLFTRADDSPGSPDTVMLTYGYWRRKFGGDRSVIGKTITVDGTLRQVVGVLPGDFRFGGADLALLVPLQFDRAKLTLGRYSFDAVARLKPGVTLEQASEDVARMIPIVGRSFPPPPGYSLKMFEDLRIAPNLRTLKQDIVGDVGNVLWVLMGGIGLVLLIACANVANLLVVRTEGRQQEIAIRAALGASRGRLAAEMMLESLVLALSGAILGLGLAYAALRVLITMAPAGLPRLDEIGIDGSVVFFTLAVSVVASLLFGSIPIVKYAGVRFGTGLREGGRSVSESRERHRSRSALVVLQVALALVLLISSGLMIRTFRALTDVDPGFVAPAQLQTLRLDIPETDVKNPERVVRVQNDILDRIASIPGVSLAAVSMSVPMDGNEWGDPVLAQDRMESPGQIPLGRYHFVGPGYFKTVGTPFIAGHDLTWSDIYNKVPVAIVSEKLAREYWTDPATAIGKQIRSTTKDEWREVIGVVADVRDDGVEKDPPRSVYWPVMAAHFESNDLDVRRFVTISIRTPRAGSESLMTEVRQAVWSVDPNLPLADVHTLDHFYRDSMARTSFTLVMLALAGGMALLLGVVGLYGVIAYSVSQRTREIGIRMALGARQPQLTGMFVRHGLWLTAAGVGFGLVAAFALMRLMSSLLFKVRPVDPVTYLAVSIGLIATAMLASYLPSRRAAVVDPVEALRSE